MNTPQVRASDLAAAFQAAGIPATSMLAGNTIPTDWEELKPGQWEHWQNNGDNLSGLCLRTGDGAVFIPCGRTDGR